MIDRISFMRRATLVRRYHQEFTHETDTVGKHSAGVALFVDLIDPEASKDMIMAALSHDLGEVVLGDIPAPTKRQLPIEAREVINKIEDKALEDMGYHYVNKLSEGEHLLLKLADYCDGLSYCTEEVARGNRAMKYVGDNYKKYLIDLIAKVNPVTHSWSSRADQVISTTIKHWEKVSER